MTLNWHEIQTKWQDLWDKEQIGKARVDHTKDKFMMIFAYPGISGYLHVGHMRGFSYTDAICRLERMRGKQVLFPVGTHASGNHAFAFANKVKNKDEKWITYLLDNGCSKEKLKELENPLKIIEYFNEVYVEEYWKKFGFLADWERFTTTVAPDYEKFIQWQFRKLHEQHLLVQKPYYATACIKDGPVAVDPSETDISKGGNAEKNEYTLLKFKLGEEYLVAATLRPETVYGQTNLWINPNAEYLKVEVDKEVWIMSKEAAEKFRYQKDDVMFKGEIDPTSLIGQKAIAPGIKKEVIILPAPFCDPRVGSGIVTSVPSNALFDYIALLNLQRNSSEIEKYGLNQEEVLSIRPIPIMKTAGYSNTPTVDVTLKNQLKEVSDPTAVKLNKELYKADHHTGVMLENCGKYAGMKAVDAKEAIKLDLLASKEADIFRDLSEEVICRCGAPVVIKRIDDQWFIKYSDSDLTEKSKKHITEMSIYPPEYKEHLPGILDWFHDRACARLGKWMGSSFPYDSKWTIEPISDSTLYPSYYIIAGFVNRGEIAIKDLTDAFFDYVFLAKGEPTSDTKELWGKIKEEFDYFYPLDMNLGGKEHKTVHFPVFVMNHIALLPHDKWPQGIFANWWVTGKGGKISKSKGGAEPIPDAIEKYGVDSMRLYYAHIGSPHIDVMWDEEVVTHYKGCLEKIYLLCEQLSTIKDNEITQLDAWIQSEFHKAVRNINIALETYNMRELASQAYFTIPDLFRWYIRRGGKSARIVEILMSKWARLLAPITPHIAEEIAQQHNLLKEDRFVSTSQWPQSSEDKIDSQAQASEELVKETMNSIRSVIKLAKLDKPTKCTLYISCSWLYVLFREVQQKLSTTRNVGEIIRTVLLVEGMVRHAKGVARWIPMLLKDVSKIPTIVTSMEAEFNTLQNAQNFLSSEFGIAIEVIPGENTDHPKAKSAMPGKVGIVLE